MTDQLPYHPVIDHEARSMAQRALDRQDSHEKFCEERARKSELFEAEMKASISNIGQSVQSGFNRIHTKREEYHDEMQKQITDLTIQATKTTTKQGVMWLVMVGGLTLAANIIPTLLN